jgi:hypothetical protein
MTATMEAPRPTVNYRRHPEYRAIVAGSGWDDLAGTTAQADWLAEWIAGPGAGDKRAERELAGCRATLRAQKEAEALHAALEKIDPATVPVMTAERGCGRKETARLARELFKRLGLKGISVTAPVYSMASMVDVQIPYRRDYIPTDTIADPSCRFWTEKEDPVRQANKAATDKVAQILAAAFPNHDDRSEAMTDYFDRKWSFGNR